ncbi:T9SS type A sorting domain-containing protein [Winogradskyella aquimaris]|uniref:T9SS type A sorting domain-containing protein n=1 Tax=Winogradskyella aquimaris TaxID=864074 RepID=A0ABU5ES10_9FLAO|nr:T9SS type A sorting domain-containing protein [Winogradskyella aquimaris]MDY2587656.1 T9SS type A sorting domain-containing protein [Winogradskyella aquimaris]
MKKITINVFVIMFMLGTFVGISQTLNQPANWPNAGWTLSGTYNPAGLLSDPSGAGATFTFDDDAAGNGNVDMVMVTSPVIDLTAASGAGETWITISGAFTYYALGGDVLAIEVYDADAMTWSQLYQFAGNTTTVSNYQNCTISEAYSTPVLDISGFTPTQLSGFQYRVSYDDVGGWQYGFCVESPTIVSATPPSCIDPSALTATSVTDTTADLGWTENGTATVWNVELVTSGTPATGTPTASGVANPYPASGLMAETAYDFYVQADCGGAGTSNWVGPFTFTTACAPIAAPYAVDFESFTVSTAPFSSENCWSGSNTGSNYYWESAAGTDTSSGGTGPDPSITTGNYFFTEASGSSVGDIAELVSPLVDLTALTTPALTFNYHMFGAEIGTLDVLVNGTDNVWTLSGEQQATATTPWELAVVDLSAYSGQNITITLRATGAGTFEGDIAIDNVAFTELPACPTPNALSATNITDTTADLGWTENGTATVWDVELGLDGFTPTGTPTAAGVANPYPASGLTENTAYDFYVRASCGGGDFSAWAGPFSFTTLETCPTPSALTATNITETTADLGWTENGTATSWNIEIVDVTAGGTATGTPTATGVTNPYTAMGLSGDNSYQYYVQADCGIDGVSAWAGPFAFSTPYVAVPPDCTNGIFLDSGGQSGNYSDNENITYTICPDNPGDAVTVDFTFFSTENNGASACYDGLTIHDGPDNTAPTIDPPGGGTIWCWDRNDTPAAGTGDLQGMMITSTDPSGCVTFVFTSDGSVQRPGWVANVFCNPLSIDDIQDEAAFTYYPNPVQNTLTLNAQNTIENVTMYNMLGQEVLRATPNTVDSELDMSSLQDGTYFVKVTIANTTKTIRVIKQ